MFRSAIYSLLNAINQPPIQNICLVTSSNIKEGTEALINKTAEYVQWHIPLQWDLIYSFQPSSYPRSATSWGIFFHCWIPPLLTEMFSEVHFSTIIIHVLRLLISLLRHIICKLIIHNQLYGLRLKLIALLLQDICPSSETPTISWSSHSSVC